jgi:uncharacterized protein
VKNTWLPILASSLSSEPNVGRLVELCEENYQQLLRLLPGLRDMRGHYCSLRHGHADLYLEVVEHARYTSLVRLTYHFEHETGRLREPDALLRVYHDAEQVEVADLTACSLAVEARYEVPSLTNKWRANLFVFKWLNYCLQQGHRFQPADGVERYATV